MRSLAKKINIVLLLILFGSVLVTQVQQQTSIREFAAEPLMTKSTLPATNKLWGYVLVQGEPYQEGGSITITGPINTDVSQERSVPIAQSQGKVGYYDSGFLPAGNYIVSFPTPSGYRFAESFGPSFAVSIGQDQCLTNYHPDASCNTDGLGNIANLNFNLQRQ